MQDEFQKTQRFLQQSKVVGHLFSSVKGGKDRKPLLVGALMLNHEECVADLHLKSCSYRKEYLANFISSSSISSMVENRVTKELFDSEAECLNSLLTNNQPLLESFYPALGSLDQSNHQVNQVMRCIDVGVVRLPLKEVLVASQVGDDVSPGKPLFFLVQGHKKNDELATYIVCVSHSSGVFDQGSLQLEAREVSAEIFSSVKNSDIKDVKYCSKLGQLVVQTVKEVSVYKIEFGDSSFAATHKSTLSASSNETKLTKIEQGQVFVQQDGIITMYSLE